MEVMETEEQEKTHFWQGIEDSLRWFSFYFFRPFLFFFEKINVSPNLITIFGMILALCSGYFLAIEKVPLSAVFFALSGVFDIVDGYVAKKTQNITLSGSFLDSFSDRISDAAIYLGLSILYLRRADRLYFGLSLFILIASFLISYIRARAEALGVTGKAGLMSRAPRFLLLGAGLFFNGLSSWILKCVTWILAALLFETVIERILKVMRELEEEK
ncbi:MAG: CDP-alcohol phosphatidyltransferase family protein [Actinomycetota bacterium]|nr:CDP-alcohol phosphatidyltransferase family protein [Actinomycetota bacterium]